MRLIDADVENSNLLDFIAEHDTGIQYALEHKDMTILEDIFLKYFEAQKTAYDVDKVVERLESHKACYEAKAAEYDQRGDIENMDVSDAVALAYGKAIKIAKAGEANG